jgi:hypothetical protein
LYLLPTIADEGSMKRICLLWLFAVLATVAAPYSAHAQRGKDGENRVVIIVNDRASDILRLYASRTTTDDWEENILSEQSIPAGKRVSINFDDGTGACLFDFRAVFRDNAVVHMFRLNVCEEVYWRIADEE